MTVLTVTALNHGIPMLAGELEDIVCQDVNFAPGEKEQTFVAEIGQMSDSVRNNVRECLARRGFTTYEFDDEK